MRQQELEHLHVPGRDGAIQRAIRSTANRGIDVHSLLEQFLNLVNVLIFKDGHLHLHRARVNGDWSCRLVCLLSQTRKTSNGDGKH